MNPNAQNSMGGYRPESEGDVIVELNDVDLADGPTDPVIIQALETKYRKWNQEYMEKLKKYRPEEYERIMEIRRQRGIK